MRKSILLTTSGLMLLVACADSTSGELPLASDSASDTAIDSSAPPASPLPGQATPTTTAEADPTVTVPPALAELALPSPAQAWAFEDDRIDLGEYQTAFSIFEDCVRESGSELFDKQTDPTSGQVSYGIAESQLAIHDQCYGEHFEAIDMVFQTTNEDILAANERRNVEHWELVMRPCLLLNGDEVPLDRHELESGDFQAIGQRFMILLQSNACES